MSKQQQKTFLIKALSFADFADGKPTNNDGNAGRISWSLVARGDQELHKEASMNDVRYALGMYANYPLANKILCGAEKRQTAFKKAGTKQMNHVRGTDGWIRTLLIVEDRALDNIMYPWCLICLNAFLATFLSEIIGVTMSTGVLQHWDTVYSLVVKTSLAFLLVFRLNRCAMRYWEARSLWGNVTHHTRNLVGGILMYCGHSHANRDMAVRWASAFCVAAMHFIRSEHEYDHDELAGFLSRDQISKLQSANHGPLHAASMVRHYLKKALPINAHTPPHLVHAYAIQLNTLEQYVSQLVAQVSGMEKIRSTPLPITYVSHLRTFLFTYCMFLPYVWVKEWQWATLPLVGFTAFALLGIEGASSEVEIPFDRSRSNHLALDAYCLIMLDSVQGLVVHDANMAIQCSFDDYNDEDENGLEDITESA